MSWPLFDAQTEVLIQGMTGKEGSRMAGWMIASGTNVVAGVTPGSGGKDVEGRPIFNFVAEARAAYPNAVVSCIVVPGPYVLSAVTEALENNIAFIHILTERVPVKDVLEIRRIAFERSATVLGPSSVGYLQFPKFRLGYLGGQRPFEALKEGGLAVLSSSGGMTNETLMALVRQGAGVRLALAVGGDAVNGSSLIEALQSIQSRPDVSAVAIFVEPGNPLIRWLIDGNLNSEKRLTICLPGDALETMPRGLPYGHTGTVLGEEDGSLANIRGQLTAMGYRCTASHDEFVAWCSVL